MKEWIERFFKKENQLQIIETKNSRDGVIDQYSDTWIFISKWAESELTRLRESNDSTKLDDSQTSTMRGRIKQLKELLALPNKKERPKRKTEEEVEY